MLKKQCNICSLNYIKMVYFIYFSLKYKRRISCAWFSLEKYFSCIFVLAKKEKKEKTDPEN